MSTAIPNATLNINTVDGLRAKPTQPIMPAVMISGITFGIKEQNNILKDRNKYNIHKAISKKAHKMLSFNPFIINLLPSRNVILVPVSVTL